MKITNVSVIICEGSRQQRVNWTFVRIDTEAGLHGIGEASLQYKDAALEAELQAFGRFLVGLDPFRIEHIWTSLHRRVTWSGGPVTMSAISAIDQALWDIKAKAFGVPVYELLGGLVNEEIRVYANGWPQGAATPAQYARRAAEVVDAGYSALKCYPFIGPQAATPRRVRDGVAIVAAMRDAVGPDVEIGVDARGRLNAWSAERAGRALEGLDIAWFEEPVLYDDVPTLAAIARKLRVPVATGEQLYTRWEFDRLLQERAVAIIQPDICHAGGVSELKKIAAAAETHYVMVAPHNSNGPISTLASLHFDATIANLYMQEVFLSSLDAYQQLLTEPLVIERGMVRLPDRPGWGADLDMEAVAARPPVTFTPVSSEPYLAF